MHFAIKSLFCVGMLLHAGIGLAEVVFKDVTHQAGVDFVHQSGAEGKRWTVEITGAGVGLLDFDNDGLLDIWVIQGGPLKNRSQDLPSDRLYRNVSEGDAIRFEDVTTASGVHAEEYGMGIVTGDIDNDNDVDVILLNFGPNQLFLNEGGKFVEQKDSSIADGSNWSISGSLADLNGDGLLDLYVGNYMEFPSLDRYKPCRRMSMRRGYCAPSNFEPTPDRLFVNEGQRQFRDVSKSSGISSATERAMGVVIDDFDRDAQPDIYVANDMALNFLWLNRGNLTFEDKALPSGVAVNGHGMREASMGVTVGDWDQDFDPDLFLTHDVKESNTLYNSEFKGWFSDHTLKAGLSSSSLSKTGFGVGFSDFENDGDLDLFIVNGSVSMIDSQIKQKIEPPLRQSNQIYLNEDGGKYRELVNTVLHQREEVSRGLAIGDLDNDGDPDLVLTNNDGPMRIFENLSSGNGGERNHWIGLRIVENTRDAIGAVVWLEGDSPERKVVRTDGSYASANDPRVIFGVGQSKAVYTVNVRWRDGSVDSFKELAVDQYHELVRPPG